MKAIAYYFAAISAAILGVYVILETGLHGFLLITLISTLLIIVPKHRYLRYWVGPAEVSFYLFFIASLCAVLLFNVNKLIIGVNLGLYFLFTGLNVRKNELKKFYSLFLNDPDLEKEPSCESSSSEPKALPLPEETLKEFSKILAKNRLILNDRQKKEGIELILTPVQKPFDALLFAGWKKASKINIKRDGTITASMGSTEKDFFNQHGSSSLNASKIQHLESNVVRKITRALHFWINGDIESAKKELEVIPKPSNIKLISKYASIGKPKPWLHFGLGSILIVLYLSQVWINPYGLPNHQIRLKSIPIQESDVLAFFLEVDQMEDLESNKHFHHLKYLMGYRALPFSPAEMVGPNLMTLLTNDTSLGQQSIQRWLQNPSDGNLLVNAFSDRDFSRCAYAGYIDLPNDTSIKWRNILASVDAEWTPISTGTISTRNEKERDMLTLRMAAHTIGALRAYTNLDAFDWSKVHRQISEVQYLAPNKTFGTFNEYELKGLEGLIISGQYPMIDTFRALQILEWTDGLDQIDQEACIKGILNQHYGKGLFFAESKTPFSIRIDGDAQNTYSAFQSLSILNALDRVSDLKKWEFRPENSGYKRRENQKLALYDYPAIEAWLMQKEFRAYMDKRN